MSNRRLLREWESLPKISSDLIKESRDQNDGKLILKGIMQKADTPNHNKRIYPRNLLHREMENFMKSVRESRATGELDHPESSTVSLKNVSHIVREAWWEGNNVMGKMEVLQTPAGRILEQLIEAGVVVGISSRGVGSTSKNEGGHDIVQDDFTLVCYDMVQEPSTSGAFMNLSEGVIEPPSLSKADRMFRALNAIRGDRK